MKDSPLPPNPPELYEVAERYRPIAPNFKCRDKGSPVHHALYPFNKVLSI